MKPARSIARRRAGLAVGLLLCGLLAAGCGRQRAGEGWFPLEPGHAWTYEVTTAPEQGEPETSTLTMRTLATGAPPGLEAEAWSGPVFHRRTEGGMDYWLQADDAGVWRVAAKTEVEADARRDAPKRWVLKAPYLAGTQWQATTTSYLLERRAEFPRELRHGMREVTMTYEIDGTGVAVETPAGHFDGCLRVTGRATVRVYADPSAGWRDLPLTTTEWYCRGIGLVRLERDEPARSPFLVGGRLTMALRAFE